MRTIKPRDMTMAALFAALMAIGANIANVLPAIQGVPLTFQTFFAILAGILLGSRLGTIAMIVYMLVGLAGVPVFSGFGAGIGQIIEPTFGFIVSFIFTAYVSGKLVETAKRPSYKIYVIASYAGLLVNYIVGTNLLFLALNVWVGQPAPYLGVWVGMMPFFIKDVLFTFLAAVLAARVHRAIKPIATDKIVYDD